MAKEFNLGPMASMTEYLRRQRRAAHSTGKRVDWASNVLPRGFGDREEFRREEEIGFLKQPDTKEVKPKVDRIGTGYGGPVW